MNRMMNYLKRRKCEKTLKKQPIEQMWNITEELMKSNDLPNEKHMKIVIETIGRLFKGNPNAFVFDQVKRYNIKEEQYLNLPSKINCADFGLRNVGIDFREPN